MSSQQVAMAPVGHDRLREERRAGRYAGAVSTRERQGHESTAGDERGLLPPLIYVAYALHYDGREASVVEAGRITYADWIEVYERDHPVRRFVEAMSLYLRDVDSGLLPGPASGETAGFYARLLLMPADELRRRAGWSDVALAEHFNVPLEEVAARRAEIALQPSST